MSLPVPFSPVMSTLASVGAIFNTFLRILTMLSLSPQNISSLLFVGVVLLLIDNALSLAASNVAMRCSFFQGFTMKSNAPRRMPSTASSMLAYAVKSTTWVSLYIIFSSFTQNSPSLPLFVSEWKFMSSNTTSGRNAFIFETNDAGDGSVSTSSKYIGKMILNVERMPALSSTTKIFPFFITFINLSAKI